MARIQRVRSFGAPGCVFAVAMLRCWTVSATLLRGMNKAVGFQHDICEGGMVAADPGAIAPSHGASGEPSENDTSSPFPRKFDVLYRINVDNLISITVDISYLVDRIRSRP